MEKRDLTCIGCPLGCQITVTMENGEVTDVKGNTCPRGDKYAREEVTNPTRVVTSIVKVEGGNPVSYTHLDVYKRQCLWYKEQMLCRFCVTKLENEPATEHVV